MKSEASITLPISIIIPTFSEEVSLPKLLESIDIQLFKPVEVIVADANSPDHTRAIAISHGCKVVDGGRIAIGRNAGANVAKGEYFLFLDADTELPNELVIGEALMRFIKDDVDIASARFIVSKHEKSVFGRNAGTILWGISNIVRSVQSLFSYPKWEGGAFILVKKSVFEHVGGFNEALTVGEDPDFFKRASKLGYRYRHLPIDVITSVRRYDSPEKLAKMLGFIAVETVLLSAGIYAGANIFKKIWKYYGRLGGGAGKDPNEE